MPPAPPTLEYLREVLVMSREFGAEIVIPGVCAVAPVVPAALAEAEPAPMRPEEPADRARRRLSNLLGRSVGPDEVARFAGALE